MFFQILITLLFNCFILNADEFFLTGNLKDLKPINEQILKNIGTLTVLTAPIQSNASQGIHGHPAVTSSVLRGLKKLDVPYNYNPTSFEKVGDNLLVLFDIGALHQGIDLKRRGKIKTLMAGPNIMANPHDHNHLLATPEIDYFLVPSLWTQVACCEEEPGIINKTPVWYVGIDTEYWKPNTEKKESKTLLIYWKTEPESFCVSIEKIAQSLGWKTIRIHYGDYSKEHYKQLLEVVDAAIFISVSESQGIALTECWAMNIPTLVWNPEIAFISLYNRWTHVSSAPYLTSATGYFFKNEQELNCLLKNFEVLKKEFNPRKWVLDHMSDEASIYLLYDLIDHKRMMQK